MGYKQVALIPDDGSRCGHADGENGFITKCIIIKKCIT